MIESNFKKLKPSEIQRGLMDEKNIHFLFGFLLKNIYEDAWDYF